MRTRVFGRLGRAGHLKKNRPGMKIAVCGCMVQEKSNVEKIRKSYRFVDLVFGTHNLYRFPEYLCGCLESDTMLVEIWDRADRIVEDLPVVRKYPFKSGTNITFGCNNFCSYCIVPYVRGRGAGALDPHECEACPGRRREDHASGAERQFLR